MSDDLPINDPNAIGPADTLKTWRSWGPRQMTRFALDLGTERPRVPRRPVMSMKFAED